MTYTQKIEALFQMWHDGKISGYYIAKNSGMQASHIKRFKDDPDKIKRMTLEKAEVLVDVYDVLQSAKDV